MTIYDTVAPPPATAIKCRKCGETKPPRAYPKEYRSNESNQTSESIYYKICTYCTREAQAETPPPWQSPFYRICPNCNTEQRNTEFPSITEKHQTDFCRTCIAKEDTKPEAQRNRRQCNVCQKWKGFKSYHVGAKTCKLCKKRKQ